MKVFMFYNNTCGCCKEWKPVYDKLVNEFNVDHEEININDNKEMKEKYGITCVPQTLFIDNDGEEKGNILGNMVEKYARNSFVKYLHNS